MAGRARKAKAEQPLTAADVAAIRAELERRRRADIAQLEGELLRRLAAGETNARWRARLVTSATEERLGEGAWRTLAEDAEGSLAAFLQQGWHVLHPGRPLEWAWYHDLICRTLERVTAGDLFEVLICIPPGFAKSMITSVYWPAWWWLRAPAAQFLTLSSADDVATRDSKRMRDVITSPWYRRILAELANRDGTEPWALAKDQNEKVNFQNTQRGSRACFSTGGSITGHRGDVQIIDDPHQIKDILGSTEQVSAALGKAHEKVDVVLPTRYNDRRVKRRVTILQRVHMEDVAAPQIADPNVYKVILPMHAYERDDPWRHPEDPREPGELLDPVFMPEDVVAREAATLEGKAPGQARAQHEMRPIPAGGGTFQRAWTTKRYSWDPQRPSEPYEEATATVDATFGSKSASASFVSIPVWARRGPNHYLVDEVHARMSYVEMRQAIKDIALKWRCPVVIEKKALGSALIEELREVVPAVIEFNPDPYGGKEARAQLATPYWQGGSMWLPEPEWCPWVSDWVTDVTSFPATTQRDRVDSMSMYVLWMRDRTSERVDHAAAARASRALLARLGRR